MKNLNEILENVQPLKIVGNVDIAVNSLQLDSRKVERDDLFFAIKGTVTDGHTFISKVIEQGASVIVCEEIPSEINSKVTYIQAKDARRASAIIATNYF